MAINLEKRLTEINKGLQTKFTLADEESLDIQRISTGLPNFDTMLGGGLPRKSATIFYGQESSGKTFLALKAIANAQSEKLECGFVDAEFSYDPVWAEKVGIQKKQLYIIQPETGEQALDATLALCKAGVDLVVVDSIAALLPTAEAQGSMEDQQMGLHARLMNKIFRKLPISMSSHDPGTAVIMINQVRAGLGGYITREALPGGKGQEFFAKIMVRMSKGESIGDKGFFIKMRTPKNKTYQPLQECTVPFYYSGEQDPTYELFTTALDLDVVSRRGATYAFEDKKAVGKDNFVSLMKEDEALKDGIDTQVRSLV